jgi:hypothetical protein
VAATVVVVSVLATVFGGVAVGMLVALTVPADKERLPPVGSWLLGQCEQPRSIAVPRLLYKVVIGAVALFMLILTQAADAQGLLSTETAAELGPGRIVVIAVAEVILAVWAFFVWRMFRDAARH